MAKTLEERTDAYSTSIMAQEGSERESWLRLAGEGVSLLKEKLREGSIVIRPRGIAPYGTKERPSVSLYCATTDRPKPYDGVRVFADGTILRIDMTQGTYRRAYDPWNEPVEVNRAVTLRIREMLHDPEYKPEDL